MITSRLCGDDDDNDDDDKDYNIFAKKIKNIKFARLKIQVPYLRRYFCTYSESRCGAILLPSNDLLLLSLY